MFLIIEENKNCSPEERMFKENGKPKTVSQVHLNTPSGQTEWCEVTGVEEKGTFREAQAVQVDDSGAGAAWLVFGGNWGIRFKRTPNDESWSLKNKNQWGEPFKVLDISGADIKFKG